MEKNWYDLSDSETEKLESEWKESKWYEKAKTESKKIYPNSGTYYTFMVLFIILELIACIMFIYAIENGESILGAIIVFVFSVICAIPVISICMDVSKEYIEKKKSEWLLEKHNIKK